ncbi:hypothetical protein [Streptomyces sp. NPDC059744]|uniref:hypothetical protein n=1 Tax=Streptomyces sp. NPDC059744 TaxID=3346929 RepID=UPI003665350A
MSITARNPRRARFAVTTAGVLFVLTGIAAWGTGDIASGVADVAMDNTSNSAWGDALAFDSDQDDDYPAAVADKDSAETQKTLGVVLAILGLALVTSRWGIRPAPSATKTQAAATFTPEQQEQAMAMYLEARKRSTNEQ